MPLECVHNGGVKFGLLSGNDSIWTVRFDSTELKEGRVAYDENVDKRVHL